MQVSRTSKEWNIYADDFRLSTSPKAIFHFGFGKI